VAPTSVDDYLAAQPAPVRALLDRVRAAIKRALPGATERISYQIPVYELDGHMVLFFAGYRGHYSIYPTTPRLLSELGSDLEGRIRGRTIRFSLEEPVPIRLVARIAKVRAAEALESAGAKKSQKTTARKTTAKKTTAKKTTAMPKRARPRA
jgi:uncharacterized protein YdhG (YjbR/CyaY superfamily)